MYQQLLGIVNIILITSDVMYCSIFKCCCSPNFMAQENTFYTNILRIPPFLFPHIITTHKNIAFSRVSVGPVRFDKAIQMNWSDCK